MRGLTPEEQRAEEMQGSTFLGLLADDVALATIRYPALAEPERRAVAGLLSMVTPPVSNAGRQPLIPRRHSMSDPSSVLLQAASIAHGDADEQEVSSTVLDLEFIRGPLQHMLAGDATPEHLSVARGFANVLASVTLDLAERLSKKDATAWTPQVSAYSAA